jgi:hypothetical protein
VKLTAKEDRENATQLFHWFYKSLNLRQKENLIPSRKKKETARL